jgi:hypothetical protein
MGENRGKVFTTIQNHRREFGMWRVNVAILSVVLCIGACSTDPIDDPIPHDTFTPITLNLNLPEFVSLHTDGGWMYYGDIGVRGVILYRANATTFRVFERTCSYQPNNACATIDVHQSQLYLFDPCCTSMFNFDGNATGGPAWRPLLQYETILDGSSLTITDQVAN